MKNIVAIIGSASTASSCHKLIHSIEALTKEKFAIKIFDELKKIPHFDPALTSENTPPEVIAFRELIENADGVIFCTPEYIFSIPSGLKNILEWSVSTTVFAGKKTGIITASTSGEKGHEEIQLILRTLMANFTGDSTILIRSIKGKFDGDAIKDRETREIIQQFSTVMINLVDQPGITGAP